MLPIFKKKDRTFAVNYRPVSILRFYVDIEKDSVHSKLY